MSECSSNYIAVEYEESKKLEKQLDQYEKLESEVEWMENVNENRQTIN